MLKPIPFKCMPCFQQTMRLRYWKQNNCSANTKWFHGVGTNYVFLFFFIIQVWLTLKGTFQSMVLTVHLTSWVPTDHTTNEECGPLISPCLIYTIHPSRQRSFTFFKHCSVNSGNHANCCHRHPWLLMRFRWKLCIHWRRKDSQALLIGFKLSSHTEEASVRWWVTSPQHIGFIF